MKRLFMLWLCIWSLFASTVLGYDTPEYAVVEDSLITLATHTDFIEVLEACTIEQSYRHYTDKLVVWVDQVCDWVEKTMIIDVLTSHPTFERVDRVLFYSFS